jgi:PAS domain S-box-containing protein
VFLSTLIEHSPCSIIATATDGEIVIFNRKAAETFGYDQGRGIGMSINRLFMANSFDTKSKSEIDFSGGREVICLRENGSQFPAYLVSSPVTDNLGQAVAYLWNLLDITESKDFQQMMIRVDRYYTRGEMAGDIAHEINNFLAVLSGNVELLPLFLKRGDQEKITKKLELMKSTVDRIAKFTDGLMDVSTDDAHFDPADVNQLVENMLAFLRPQNRFDNIDVVTDLDGDLTLVQLDVGQIQQLLVNLLNNAADAVAGCELRKITVRTRLIETDRGRASRIEIVDSGPGVKEDKQALLFEKRFTTKRKGHGYGLITCRRIVDAHGGKISYERSAETRFTVDLPLTHTVETVQHTSEPAATTKVVAP